MAEQLFKRFVCFDGSYTVDIDSSEALMSPRPPYCEWRLFASRVIAVTDIACNTKIPLSLPVVACWYSTQTARAP